MVSIRLCMRKWHEFLASMCPARDADNEPATRMLSFLKVGRRITDLRHSPRIVDPKSGHQSENHIRMRTPSLTSSLQMVASIRGDSRPAQPIKNHLGDRPAEARVERDSNG